MRLTRPAVAGLLGLLSAPAAQAQLLHRYSFSGPTVADGVGSAAGTLFGGALVVSGGHLQLGSGGGYVQFGSHLIPTSGSYTVGLWARENGPSALFTELISQGVSGGPGFYIGTNPSHSIRVSDSWISTGVAFPTDLGWHRYVLVVDAAAASSRLWVDGSIAAQVQFAITSTTGGVHTRLGRQFDPFTEYFDGDLDEVRVYGGAVGAETIEAWSRADPVSTVPEPGAIALLAPALLALAIAGWRQRQHPANGEPPSQT